MLGKEYKICNYADDTNFFLSDFNAVTDVFLTYNTFKAASGATLKTQKTQILMLGCSKIILAVPKKYDNFITNKIKIYGVTFDRKGPEETENMQVFNETLRKLKTRRMGEDFSYISK